VWPGSCGLGPYSLPLWFQTYEHPPALEGLPTGVEPVRVVDGRGRNAEVTLSRRLFPDLRAFALPLPFTRG
jgi:hypothetical protein